MKSHARRVPGRKIMTDRSRQSELQKNRRTGLEGNTNWDEPVEEEQAEDFQEEHWQDSEGKE
jgi:hypothetical protein